METIVASSAAQWRGWLAANGQTEKEVWLIIHHKDSGTPSLRYAEAIEHALCFGWIDGLHKKRDAESSQLRFTPRKPSSSWSKVNRERAENMIAKGLMAEPGQALIDLAKSQGTWEVVVDGEGSALPADLQKALDANDAARGYFEKFPPSARRLILEWIVTAKRPETRERRIEKSVALAAQNIRANNPGTRQPKADPA